MPRRNHRQRRRFVRGAETEPTLTPPPSFEAMARELVKAGKRSPLILDHPHRFTERNPA